MLKKTKENFFNKIALKDFKTRQAYERRISKWEYFCLKNTDKSDYIPKTLEETIEILQLFINWFSLDDWNNQSKTKGHSPNSVWNYASSIRKYLYYRGSPITKDDFQEHIELPKKIEKELHGLSLDEITRILNDLDYENRVMFLCQLSAGMRIGELVQLRKKHLKLDTDRIIVKIPAKIAKFKRARTTFFSKEAAVLLRVILKRKEDDDLIFGTSDVLKTAENNKGAILRNHLDKIGLGLRYEDTGNYQINTHSFRAYFITKVSRHDENLAKFLAGEKGYLLQYDRMTEEEKLEKYMDIEKDLFIYDLSKKDDEIKKLRIANTKLVDQEQELQSQAKQIKELQIQQEDQARLLRLIEKYPRMQD